MALDPATPLIQPEQGDNCCFTRSLDVGNAGEAFAAVDVVAEATFEFGRQAWLVAVPAV